VVDIGKMVLKLWVLYTVGAFMLCKAGRYGGKINNVYVAGIIVVL
jgi:hypothetical protein